MLILLILLLEIILYSDNCIPTQTAEEVYSTTTSTTSSTTSTTTSTTTTTTSPTTTGIWSCPDSDWTIFDRGTYSWCMRPAYGNAYLGSAGSLCTTLDSSAVLSGFQDLAELSELSSEAAAYDSSILYMAIGAIRSDNCKTQASLSTAACSGTNIFVWDDGHTTGSAGFDWFVNTPNGCFNTGCDIANWAIVYPSLAKLDDFPANWAVGGAICGMEATYS